MLDPENFKQSVITDVLSALKQQSPLLLQKIRRQQNEDETDDRISIAASNNYNLNEDDNTGYIKTNVPEDSSSESSIPGDISSEKLKDNSLTLKKTSHTDGAGG